MTKKKTVYVSALPLRDDAAYEAQAAAPEGQARLRLPPLRGHGPQAHRASTTRCATRTACARAWPPSTARRSSSANYDEWAPLGGSIVWSPFSNLWLYRGTTDVLAARAAGVRICLGADWSPSGSKNLLGELKVADLWNRPTQRRAQGRGDLRDGDAQPRRRHQLGRRDRAAEARPARRRARHHRPRLDDPYREPHRVDRARRAARRHQRPAVLRHHEAHEGGGRAARRADQRRAPAPLGPAHLRRRPRGRHGLEGGAGRHRRRHQATRSGATSSSRSSTATRTPRSARCGS